MLTHKIKSILDTREFISVATCDFKGKPNVAPKFVLKHEGSFIYLADHVIGRSYENLKANPRVSLGVMNMDNLTGYQVNGTVELIEKGEAHDKFVKEFIEKEISLSAKRIIEGVGSGKKHTDFELSISNKIVIFKVKIEDIAEIYPSGKLKRENI